MNAESTPEHSGQPSRRGQGRHRWHRRGPRTGQNTTRATNEQPNPQASTESRSTSLTNAESSSSQPGSPGNSNSRRRGRGRGRGGSRVAIPGGRSFGAQLTADASATSTTILNAETPEFQPGQPVAPQTARRMSKSQAPDIATRIHQDIAHGLYECPICTNEVLRNSKIWSCKTCWSVFHLHCIKKWSKNEGSTQRQAQPTPDGELPPARQWRCPGCNLPTEEVPSVYSCWCGRDIDPKPIPGIPPHSCGSTCSRARARCPHKCPELCHAGPCPPCTLMGPSQPCFCGKEVSTKRCVETKYDQGWSCDSICGELLPCGEHTCQQKCHEGLCGTCEVLVDSRCYCGKVSKPLPCADRGDLLESSKAISGDETEGIDSWTGSFDCGGSCERQFDCGKHSCQKGCHEQTVNPAHCPLSPDVVSHCPCGKTPLGRLLSHPRMSCEDRIPHCEEICSRHLPCGHQCRNVCHSGDCPPCSQTVSVPCRCGRTESRSVCHYEMEEPPQCSRICKTTLNCGRHECGEHCCSGEKKAMERQASRRKRNMNSQSTEEFEAEHICTRVCGRQLKCGNEAHTCQELCHRGLCGSCREAIFDEISCHCGRSVLYPPLPCGTQPPPCSSPCNRPPTCGHPPVPHNCHGDSEACPKCPFLMQKTCMCGKKVLKNQPCWFNDASCGIPCEKLLRCGAHRCLRSCHRGPCEGPGESCKQLCGRPKVSCGHPDLSSLCHSPYPCKEDKPCQLKIFITCACQHKKQEVKCLAMKSDEGNSSKVLACDDECLRLQRNAKLADALKIDPTTHMDDHIPYSKETLDMYKDKTKWCQTQEREFRVFASLEKEKRLRFPPMKAPQRAFLHSLAEDYGLDSESMDPEPHRHVAVFKTPRFVSAPMKTLGQCVKIQPKVEAVASKQSTTSALPWNAFVLSSPQFGLTIDELRRALQSELASAPSIPFNISFLPSEEIVIHAKGDLPTSTVAATLTSMKAAISDKIKALQLASSLSLCHVDSSLNILRRESDQASTGGWSQVAKRSAAKQMPEKESIGHVSSFAVLGRIKAKKPKEEDVTDDWETLAE